MAEEAPQGASPTPEEDPDQAAADLKAKFREALDRKRHNQHASAGGPGGDRSGKPHHESGAAGGHREFRRKSG